MKNKKVVIGIAALALTLSAGSLASEIYKWTDEDGTVHYGDRPSGAATEQRLALTYRRTTGASVDRQMQALADSRAARDEARTAADQQAQEAAAAAAEEDARAERCTKYRAQLESMLQARRLYREDKDGERVYLDDDQRQEARMRAEELIAENCTA